MTTGPCSNFISSLIDWHGTARFYSVPCQATPKDTSPAGLWVRPAWHVGWVYFWWTLRVRGRRFSHRFDLAGRFWPLSILVRDLKRRCPFDFWDVTPDVRSLEGWMNDTWNRSADQNCACYSWKRSQTGMDLWNIGSTATANDKLKSILGWLNQLTSFQILDLTHPCYIYV
jgi:hypothetical protein